MRTALLILVLPRSRSCSLACCDNLVGSSATCFYGLLQPARVQRSLDIKSAKTLIHAYVTSRVDYCNSALTGATKSITDKLLNAAAYFVRVTRKFDRCLSHLLHYDMHWLDAPQRVQYKLGLTVHNKSPE